MTRIAIAGFQHETNTFAPDETTLEHFVQAGAWPAMTRGDDIFSVFQGLNIPISGFIQACPFQMVPILWAMAEPGGYVTDHAFDTITGEIVEGIAQANPQAVYLDLHGAMVTRTHPDAEAEILRRIRARMGDALPIVVSLDLHGNLSPAFFQLASAVTPKETAPPLTFTESLFKPIIFILAKPTTAKASFNSKYSISSIDMSIFSKALGIAFDGAVVNHCGSWAASA